MTERPGYRERAEAERRIKGRLQQIRVSLGLPRKGQKPPDREAHRAKLDERAAEYHRISGGEFGWDETESEA